MLYDPANSKPGDNGFVFNQSRNETGNFNISTFTFFRSFADKSSDVKSSLFDEFRLVRFDVAKELGAANAASPNNPLGSTGQIQYVNSQAEQISARQSNSDRQRRSTQIRQARLCHYIPMESEYRDY